MRSHGTDLARKHTKILIGPWSHSSFNANLKNYGIRQRWLEEIPFEYVKEMKDWLDFTLKGVDNGWAARPAVKAYVLGDNTWRFEEDWPPRAAKDQSYYLHSAGNARTLNGDGALRLEKPSGSQPEDSFVFDPCHPVPTRGGGHGDAGRAGPPTSVRSRHAGTCWSIRARYSSARCS